MSSLIPAEPPEALPAGWSRQWRDDRGIWENKCPHGIGHPTKASIERTGDGMHGCDGCCAGMYAPEPWQLSDLQLAKLLTYDFNSSEQWFLDTCLRAGIGMPNAKFAVRACFEAKSPDAKMGEGEFFRGAQFILQLIGAQPAVRAALVDIARAKGLVP